MVAFLKFPEKMFLLFAPLVVVQMVLSGKKLKKGVNFAILIEFLFISWSGFFFYPEAAYDNVDFLCFFLDSFLIFSKLFLDWSSFAVGFWTLLRGFLKCRSSGANGSFNRSLLFLSRVQVLSSDTMEKPNAWKSRVVHKACPSGITPPL